ncbi:four-helix bundle copper-binding protein [uncultured Bdellovibrio sp.]|uniref:four-helix bundle copper-binding protein n=1 Tax=Bdellovibrio sp. HCB-162 TaxID=3394234 RepID=UPI0025F9D75F|nr:four-helix bundle copper-binding protein [uncultured Bdellovibrio sp.]
MPTHPLQDSDITKCINLCFSCSRSCLETLHYCMEEKGTAFSGKHLSLLQFCVDACQMTARLLIAESEFYNQSCELTFELCRACAIECERYEYDEVFQQCADICRSCAESCRGMSGMTVRVPKEEIERKRNSSARANGSAARI